MWTRRFAAGSGRKNHLIWHPGQPTTACAIDVGLELPGVIIEPRFWA